MEAMVEYLNTQTRSAAKPRQTAERDAYRSIKSKKKIRNSRLK